MSNNKTYIKFLNMDNESSEILNKAFNLSISSKCKKVSTYHIIISFLLSKTGSIVLERLGTNNKDVIDFYNSLINDKILTVLKTEPKFDFKESLDREVVDFMTYASVRGTFENRVVDAYDLYYSMCYNENTFGNLLITVKNIANVNIEENPDYIYSLILENTGYVPNEFTGLIEDLSIKETDDIIVGVDKYIDDLIEVLNRKLKANPCLIGEAGVGKTTIVKGLVERIKSGNVPDRLKNIHICELNGAFITAGTKFRGELEERLFGIIEWAKETNVILFIDEIHTFVGAGANSGTESVGNMIKKVLSSGEIKIIGATTLSEYHKFIEKDKALSRRLQEIEVKEPSIENTIEIVKNSIRNYEDFHNIVFPHELIELAVKLSARYIKNKKFPDKAYTVIDQSATVAKLKNKFTVEEIDVLNTISKVSGIDINKISSDELDRLVKLEDILSRELIGQYEAVKTVSKAIRRSKAGVREQEKPIASFLFVGPTGVGKTELCKVINKEVALSNSPIIKLDMSEYSEKNTVSGLIGTTAGYIGYGDGGKLTEAVKHNPNSLILFDEIEKAHPDIYNVLLQILDEGKLTDGEGETVDFTNTIIVLTSNAGYGAELIKKGTLGFGKVVEVEKENKKKETVLESLKATFKPEFLNRIDNVVVFNKLSKENTLAITKLLLDKLSKRLLDTKNIKVSFNKNVIEYLNNLGYSEEYGARNLKRVIQDTVEDILADKIISRDILSGDTVKVSYIKEKINVKVVK